MADITEVEATYSRKVQLEQFEPIEHRVTLVAELFDEDDPDAVYDEISDSAEDMVERAIAHRVTQTKLAESENDESE